MDYHSGLKRGYTGSFTLASLVRNVKTVKSFCPVCNGALKADIAMRIARIKIAVLAMGFREARL